jgi:DNA-binding NarL/FixJ family response regulator
VITVLLVDDEALVRGGFRMILESQDDIAVVGEAEDGSGAIRQVRELNPDVVLMDIRMPRLDGIEATRRILRESSASRVLILTTFDLDEYVYDALQAGASGFVLKSAPPARLADAVRTVAAGDAMLAPELTRRLIEEYLDSQRRPVAAPGLSELTDRELDVLRLMAQGRSNAELAAELIVSESTVKTHVTRILAKLGLRDRLQAVVLAYESGLVQPGRNRDVSGPHAGP